MYIENRVINTKPHRNECLKTPKLWFGHGVVVMVVLATAVKPVIAFSGSITSFPNIRNLHHTQRQFNNIHSVKTSKPADKYSNPHQYSIQMHMSGMESDLESGKEEEIEVTSLKENEEFQAAVTEVKVAAKNVTDSTVALTNTIVRKGPNIIGILLQALVSNELRCARYRFSRFPILLHLL